MPEVSVIVPVYNCEQYLERCICSILKQTQQDIQLILVDDGSTDGSGRLCDAFAAKDDRVVVIHQKNAGVSAARNAALNIAAGKYVGFVDADDYISEDSYEIAVAKMNDCDIVMWDTVSVWDDGRTAPDTIPMLSQDCLLRKADWKPELLTYMAGSACRCLYKAELISDIRFSVGIKLSEDRLFNLEAMGKAAKLCYMKKGLYYRYMRQGSAVNRYHGDKFEKNLEAMDIAGEIIRRYWDERYLAAYMKMFVVGGAMSAIYEICSRQYSGRNRLKAIKEIAEHEAVATAFRLNPARGLREKLLKNKMNAGLLMFGMAWNIKNGASQ